MSKQARRPDDGAPQDDGKAQPKRAGPSRWWFMQDQKASASDGWRVAKDK